LVYPWQNFLFRKIPRKELEELILTRDRRYSCALIGRSGLINSAIFCEELASKMLEKYPSRFKVYEDTLVQKIEFGKGAILRTPKHELNAQQIVLCTNGYGDLEINGLDVALKCKIEGVLGYMAGYLDERELQPTATVYFSPGVSSQPMVISTYLGENMQKANLSENLRITIMRKY
jgi:hypothetical protein